MNRFIRKSWYTLTEAAQYLTQNTQGEERVTVSDLLQIADEGIIPITLRLFSMAPASDGELLVLVGPGDEKKDLLAPPNAQIQFCTADQYQSFVESAEIVEQGPPTLVFQPWRQHADIKHELAFLPIGSGKTILRSWWRAYLEHPSGNHDQLIKATAKDDPQLSQRPIFLMVPDAEAPRTAKTTLASLPDDTFLGVTRDHLDLLLADSEEVKADGPTNRQVASYNQLPEDFQALINDMGNGEQPNMDLLIAAWRTHWKGRVRNDGKPFPKNADVEKWILDRMEGNGSKIMAKYIAQIIRPQWAPKHRHPQNDK